MVLQGGWGLFRNRSSGEILLRLTYKAYVEDEDDDKMAVESADMDISDDELSDFDESRPVYKPVGQEPSSETDKESFMDVLAALIVSEEFQGIVASEAGSGKLVNDALNTASTRSRSRGVNGESVPPVPDNNSDSNTPIPFSFWVASIC